MLISRMRQGESYHQESGEEASPIRGIFIAATKSWTELGQHCERATQVAGPRTSIACGFVHDNHLRVLSRERRRKGKEIAS